MLVVFGD
jgi:MFS family permease